MRRSVGIRVLVGAILLLVCAAPLFVCEARQQPPAATASAATLSYKPLTVERIYGDEPSLSGQLTRGIQWTPDSKQISFFDNKGTGKGERTELWALEVATGERRVLISAEKLEAVLPADSSPATQATGLGRHPQAEYQWAPGGGAVLFQGPTSLAWFDLKTQTSRTLVSGKENIADPKISPDGRTVSFVRGHNLWLVNIAGGEERAFTEGGTEEVRK